MPTKRKPHSTSPAIPLSPKREAFCLAILSGQKLQQAHKSAGFDGKAYASAWQIRHSPDIDARIRWMLEQRVKAHAASFVRRGKIKGDLLDAAVKRLADLAFTDAREIVAWDEETVTSADGEISVRPRLVLKDSKAISPQAATLIKGAFMKAGEIRIDLHDQRGALVDLIKTLKGSDAVTNNVTVTNNTLNVGAVTAQDAAQRIAFLLSAAQSRLPAMKTIEAEPVRNSRDVDEEPKDR